MIPSMDFGRYAGQFREPTRPPGPLPPKIAAAWAAYHARERRSPMRTVLEVLLFIFGFGALAIGFTLLFAWTWWGGPS